MHFSWNKSVLKEGSENLPSIVLAHGFGANMQDLVPIASELGIQANWYFPQAPVVLQPGSYAWFPDNQQDMEAVYRGQYFDRIEDMQVPDLDTRVDQLVEDMEELGIKAENCFLGGFSQGSMLALRCWLRTGLPFAGLLLLSSTLLDRNSSTSLLQKSGQLPVFQSHGSYDQVLPFAGAKALHDLLVEHGLAVHFVEFPGMHEIPMKVIEQLREFINDRLR